MIRESAYDQLLDHIDEFHSELIADLETGSHHFNNAVAGEFVKQHPILMAWVTRLFALKSELLQEDQ